MIELAFIACLSAEPSACERKSLVFDDVSAMTCLMGAQPVLADWIGTHPQWRIARWSCQSLRAGGQEA
ncbi:hypothetical protein [Xinfangfangia pollutisoli]|uniref:hypothetical protein n=1 Tax=Xinfangfangia pollutisoli TaxID=2865960 RepID=UPI001CD64AC9|nr:hypothetical protein [Xinfangfangia pollutisoli]